MLSEKAGDARRRGETRMGDILEFTPHWDDPAELDAEAAAMALARVEALIARLDEEEPEDMDSEAYETWGDRREELEDLADDLRDRLDELE